VIAQHRERGSVADEIGQKLLDKLPKSIFTHRVMARISIQEEDWANAVSFAEKGRVLLKELETERGISLARCV
jgi:superkiller protein 3